MHRSGAKGEMMKWIWIKYDGAIGHVVPETFLDAVKNDLESRDCAPIMNEREISDYTLDLPGMMIVGSPTENLGDYSGLRIECFSHLVVSFITRIDGLKPRKEGYYKLHCFHSCIVLSEDQKNSLLESLIFHSVLAEERSDMHLARWKEDIKACKIG
jgi:hypothetical protein